MFAIAIIIAAAPAQPPPVAWELTGTSSVAVPDAPATHKVERRVFRKKSRLAVRSGFAYLARGDFYTSPGVGVDLTWYPEETIGIDVASATFFFSQLTSTAALVRETTGFLPDSQKPLARVTTGARLPFAYGKLLVESLDAVIHMDASASAHFGFLITSEAPNLGGDLGLSLQVAVGERFLVWTEASFFVSYENRSTSSFAAGPLAAIGIGLLL